MTAPFDKTDAALLDALADAVRPAELSAQQRDSMRERILRRIKSEPPQLTRTIRRHEGDWVQVNPLVKIKTLRRDWESNTQTVLIRMAPGATVVSHQHILEEECLVLEGELEIGDHRLFEGDMHIAAPHSVHPPLTTRTGVLLLLRSEIPLSVTRPG